MDDRLPPTTIQGTVTARALLLGERLDVRKLAPQRVVATNPATVRIGGGYAVLFRYGAIVMVDVPESEAAPLLASLQALTIGPYPTPESDVSQIDVRADQEEGVDPTGVIRLKSLDLERIQLVAHILAKSLVLADQEARISTVFDRIEPLAESLRRRGRAGGRVEDLVRDVGSVLSVQHRMVGRVETREKPDLLWDHPELERLYIRLAEEYELRERDLALDRKLELVSRTAATLQSLLQNRSSLRLEWYIVILIVVEIALSVYALVLH